MTMEEKVRALLAKTAEGGCTEGEASAAADLARKLIEKYQITLGPVALASGGVVELGGIGGDSFTLTFQRLIGAAIHEFCEVKTYFHPRSKTFTIVGYRSDVDFAKWLIESLTKFASAGASVWVKGEMSTTYAHLTDDYKSQRRNKAWALRKDFAKGCAYRISCRLLDLVETRKKEVISGSRALVPIDKTVAIKAFVEGLRLGKSRGMKLKANTAFYAGHAHGANAQFGRAVENKS